MPNKRNKPKATKQPVGRPPERTMPEPIDDTPENIAKAIMRNPPKKNWRYLGDSGRNG